MISEEYKSPKSGDKSYDMIGSTRQYLSKSLIKWIKNPRSEFDMWEQLNDEWDKEAGKFRKWCERQHRATYCITPQMNHGQYGEEATRYPRTFTKMCMMESKMQRQIRYGPNQDV
jgi:hypothetical protein